MFKKISEMRERHAYKVYSKLNAKRKAKEGGLKLFKAFDDIRRKSGFVK